MARAPLDLTRSQILAFRRHVGALDERLPRGQRSLRRAAWAGLPDSMPRAALLSIHARVAGTEPSTWQDPSLVQLWGPRFSVFVVAARDRAVFSLGTLPDDAKGRQRAEDLAARLSALLGGARMSYAEAGRALGVHHNLLRYAAATGTVLIRWDGARRPTVWTVARRPVAPARLLPSGDTYLLFHGRDRELLVPDAARRGLLWTPRVWPGGVLVGGQIVGTWRRRDLGTLVRWPCSGCWQD